MHCMAGLDTVTSGQVFIDGEDVSTMSDRERTMLRRDKLGFVFQAFNLVPTLSARENIACPYASQAAIPTRRGSTRWWPPSASAAAYAHRVVFLVDGKIVNEMLHPTSDAVLDHMKTLGN